MFWSAQTEVELVYQTSASVYYCYFSDALRFCLKLLAIGDVVIHRWLVQPSSSPGDSSSRVHVLLADCSLEVRKKATWEQQKSKVNDGLKVNKSIVVLEICQRHRSVFGTQILSVCSG